MVFKWRRLKEISVYHQHTVGVRGHALLWSGLCVRYGKVYNKCTMCLWSSTPTPQFKCLPSLTLFMSFLTDVSDKSTTANTFDLGQCQEELRAYYLEEMGKVNLLPWIPGETKDMESIFVDLQLVRKKESKSPQDSQDLTRNEDLVTLKTDQGQRVNRVLVTGDAGSGKSTTAANIAYKWATLKDPQSPLSQFSLVFLLRMKDIVDSNLTLVDLIFQHILPEGSKISKEGLDCFIWEHAKDILFIIDGMDEDSSDALKSKSCEISKLLHNVNSKLRQCCVVLTTRPENVSDLGQDLVYYTEIKLKGFSLTNVRNYIVKYFRNDKAKVDKLIRKLQDESHIEAMASIPVLLLMICLLWEDQSTIPKTKTQLYQETIKYLWKRHKARPFRDPTLVKDSDNEEFDEELKELLKQLGKVALRCIDDLNNSKFIFTEAEFEKDVCNLGCQVGILTREQSRSGLKNKTSVTFLHSTFQEFCASVYLAYLLETKQVEIEQYHGKLFMFSETHYRFKKHVVEFCCGIQPQVTTTLLQYYLDKKTEHAAQSGNERGTHVYIEISFYLLLIFESQLSFEQCMNLIPLLASINAGIEISHYLIPSVLYLLELHKLSVSHTGFLSIVKLLEIRTGCTPWLLTLLKYTTNLQDCRVHLDISSTKADLDKMYKALSALAHLQRLVLYNKYNKLVSVLDRFDVTNLLKFLTESKVYLSMLCLLGVQFDVNVMARYLSSRGTSMSCLELAGSHDSCGQLITINEVIENLPSLRNLHTLFLVQFQISGVIKKLRPIVSQLERLHISDCRLRERHMKELLSILSRAQKLKSLDLSVNLFSVALVEALVESLKKMPHLEELILKDTGLNDESACILAKFVKGKSSIRTLCLDNNPGIGVKGKDAL